MRDAALQQAIDAVGGVGALAKGLGIAQPSVSTWTKVPAERVIAVESLTGVSRAALRPDLYPANDTGVAVRRIDDIDEARAQLYLLLAKLLRRAPDEAMVARIAHLKGDASELGVAILMLADAASGARVEDIGNEFFTLFVGVGRGEFLPYGSYYLTGFLNERPLARLRSDLQRLGIERAPGDFEPEDHAAILLEVMAGLVDGTFEGGADEEKALFEKHVKPWMARFFADLEINKTSAFYRAVGSIGRRFMEIEAEAFTIGA